MHILLDHISARSISSVLVAIFVLLQVRGTQSNSEATVNYMVRSETMEVSEMLQRDLFNMRSQVQTSNAESIGKLNGTASNSCSSTASAGGDTTLTFTFPTMSNPQAMLPTTDPDTMMVDVVTYQLIKEAGKTITGNDTLTSSIASVGAHR